MNEPTFNEQELLYLGYSNCEESVSNPICRLGQSNASFILKLEVTNTSRFYNLYEVLLSGKA